LYNATDLYHAPFFGFYRDLSAPDPYFILPILLGVFMVLQQKMSPSMGDPTQAKMMMLMPVLFAGFMLFLPLGLVLYIFVNTVMTVVQQYMNQKNISLLSLIRRKPG
jgi:YidC/Oxa1 family membrane protein insertase